MVGVASPAWVVSRPEGRKVVLGVHSLSQPEDTKQVFDIAELHNHPDYNPLNYDNDIALIKVSVWGSAPFGRMKATSAALLHS